MCECLWQSHCSVQGVYLPHSLYLGYFPDPLWFIYVKEVSEDEYTCTCVQYNRLLYSCISQLVIFPEAVTGIVSVPNDSLQPAWHLNTQLQTIKYWGTSATFLTAMYVSEDRNAARQIDLCHKAILNIMRHILQNVIKELEKYFKAFHGRWECLDWY